MLPTLRLFNSIACPDHRPPKSVCSRQPCLFSHLISHITTSHNINLNLNLNNDTNNKLINSSSSTSDPKKKLKPCHNQIKTSQTSISSSSGSISSKSQPANSLRSTCLNQKTPSNHNSNSLNPPRISINKSSISHTSIPTRQKLLQNIYNDYISFYTTKLNLPDHLARALAHDDSLEEELDCYQKSNKSTYRNTVIGRIVAIRRRFKQLEDLDELNQEDRVKYLTGNMSKFQLAQAQKKIIQENQNWYLNHQKLEKFILSKEKMFKLDYITEIPQDFIDQNHLTSKIDQQTCERCSNSFNIIHSNQDLSQEALEECTFHWGKPIIERVDGLKQRIFTCCHASLDTGSNNQGCTKGPHVFIEKSLTKLHHKSPFVRLPLSSPQDIKPLRLAAIDCELIYTSEGMSLARVTVVIPASMGQETLLDEYIIIPPSIQILDLNTRFSGIRSSSMLRPGSGSQAKFNLVQVRQELIRLGFSSQTIICGHGLENDLKALRIIHDRCIDTVDLFPHPRGLPMRMSLKKLASIFLNKLIQQGGSIDEEESGKIEGEINKDQVKQSENLKGHDSLEDATVSLELVKYKVQQS